MVREPISIGVDLPELDRVQGLLDIPARDAARAVILLAHGAGAGMTHPFMAALAEGLAGAGFPVLRFHYAYAQRMQDEERRRPPDRRPILEQVHRAALAALEQRFGDRRLLLAGKSMGGRMSSYLAADGAAAHGLVLFGYPLHPPGKPERKRDDHFGHLHTPALFLQGTRDALCDLDLLENSLASYVGPWHLHRVDGADHGFSVLRRSGRSDAEVLTELVSELGRWERETF